jgi:hypothetical protein
MTLLFIDLELETTEYSSLFDSISEKIDMLSLKSRLVLSYVLVSLLYGLQLQSQPNGTIFLKHGILVI